MPTKKAVKKTKKVKTPVQNGEQPASIENKPLEEFRKKQLAIANKYKDEILKKYKDIVKAVVLFGSFTRTDFHKKSDIDMLVIIDDTLSRFTPEMKARFDDDLYSMGKKLSEDIVVQPAWTLTEFWDMARIGHPLLYTIVRDGWALYDTGFWIPVRKLLEYGKIPTTLEAVEKFMESAPQKITRVETAKLYMVAEDVYYAMLNSSQAVLMYMGLNPPSPKHTTDSVKEHLVDAKLLEENYLRDLESVIDFRKRVEHKEIKDITGVQLDDFIQKSKNFVSRMEQMLLHLQKNRKKDLVQRNYEVMIKAAVAGLKNIDKLPPDPKDLPGAIKTHLIDAGRLDQFYDEVLKRVVSMRKMLDEDRTGEIPQRDIELMREYVRRFVKDMSTVVADKKRGKK
ncbi:MAG: nucleotidyltransferase domain-containing protein [Candidatus Aenigmarchaeota archaeon]|nr:nucleotidyltransferase domain-containing protein [Candidatus Aenigmarchaeota archaeon]